MHLQIKQSIFPFIYAYTNIPPEPVWHWHNPPSPQLQDRLSLKATAPTRPARFSAGCGPGKTSCQSAGRTVATSPQASAHQHPANTATAAARLREVTLQGMGAELLCEEHTAAGLVLIFTNKKRWEKRGIWHWRIPAQPASPEVVITHGIRCPACMGGKIFHSWVTNGSSWWH